MFGLIFLGAATYFIYGALDPHWGNAVGQLAGFLAYDLVLLSPFFGHFDSAQGGSLISLVRGLHLTGVAQVSGPPRPLGRRPLQARRMPAPRWRSRRDLPGPLAGDNVAVAHRIVACSELEQPVEDEAAASRA